MADRDRMDDRSTQKTDLDDPLGIAQTPVAADAPEHLRPTDDEASVRRRRERAGLGRDADDRTTDGMGDLNRDHKGATAIDMGHGGEGNQIATDRSKP